MSDWNVFRWGRGMWVASYKHSTDRFAVYSTWGEAIKHALREAFSMTVIDPCVSWDRAQPNEAGVLTEAASILNGTRAQDYGENSLPRIAAYWSAYLEREVSGRDVANLMILLKVAREGHSQKRDNHVDIAGYVALADQL